MSEVFWRESASGTLIDPAMIPGTDIDGTALSTVAAGFRNRGGLLTERAEVILGDWSGLQPVYAAPEASTLLTAMDPIRTDVGVTADKLGRAADRIDDLAGLVSAPVRRLRELKTEAEEFVASVRGGVTVGAMDPDNPHFQNAMMTEGGMAGLAMAPEGSNNVTLNWSEHTPSVNRNNELFEQVNAEVVRIYNAVADCVNGINALIDGYCAPGMTQISEQQLAAMTETDYGASGKGDRSCSESIGDGMVQAGGDMFKGLMAIAGFSIDDDWNWSEHSIDTTFASLGGVLQGLGAIALIGPPTMALMVTPEEDVPEWLHGFKDWHGQQMTGLVEGIVGDPEMWAEDPVAAGAFAVTNVGSFFIPAAGAVGAAGKVGGVAARLGTSTVRLGYRLEGAFTSSVVVNVGEVMARTGNVLTDFGRGSSAASRAELAGVLEVFEQTRVARNELNPPVGFGERMNAAVEQAAQLPARATEAMQHLGDRLGVHVGGGVLPAFADGVPGGGNRFDVDAPNHSIADVGVRLEGDERPNPSHDTRAVEEVIESRAPDVDADGAPPPGSNQLEGTESSGGGVVFDAQGQSVPLPRDVSVIDGDVVLVVEGQAAGRIPVDDYVSLRAESIHNPGVHEVVLGKYAAPEGGPPYLVVAGERGATYFDMGEQWGDVMAKYGLDDDAMFRYFNIPVLDEALNSGQRIFFSHDPTRHTLSALGDEWAYLKEHGYYMLEEVAGGWIARR